MSTTIPGIQFPELFFGFVSQIGADHSSVITEFRRYLEAHQYRVIHIKVTDAFPIFKKSISAEPPLARHPLEERYKTHIAYGNALREFFNDDAVLAAVAIQQIIRKRVRLREIEDRDRFTKTAYLIDQFKRREEVDLFRATYNPLFFQISTYSRRGSRVDSLSRRFASSESQSSATQYRANAEAIIQQDENESDKRHGQRVGKIFHDADFVVSLDIEKPSVQEQVVRFCELLFSSNSISPSKEEYGVFMAKAAALRTLDLSRQVGAAIFTTEGEVVALGSNEVPKATGGSYWPDGRFDDREFKRGQASNDQRKRAIFSEIIKAISPECDVEQLFDNEMIRESQFMDALEYGRIVHAEMSAIMDAARLGRSTKSTTLYCTTFPCHMCAKHIVSSGISRVIFLEPYPKSLAADLHSDALLIEGSDRGKYQGYPAVEFSHFFGVTPRRYRELFERGRRKDASGSFVHYSNGCRRFFLDIKAPSYVQLEELVLQESAAVFQRRKLDLQTSLNDFD